MNAIEPVIEYFNNLSENQDGNAAPAAWPIKGNIKVTNLTVGHAPDLPPVLRRLTFNIQSG